MSRVLVAGAGNIFLGDDGFGVEVAARLAREPLPDGVEVEDFGIRGVHLAYTLLDGYDVLILVDAVPRGDEPGTVYVIRADLDAPAPPEVMDAHDLAPETVLALLTRLGGRLDACYVVGCEPAGTEGIGLSEPVAAAVDTAVARVRALVDEVLGEAAGTVNGRGGDAEEDHRAGAAGRGDRPGDTGLAGREEVPGDAGDVRARP
jgi:hydrogenase maturation protease